MSSGPSRKPGSPSGQFHSIPLQNLTRPPDHSEDENGERSRHTRGRSLLGGVAQPRTGQFSSTRYERIGDSSPSPTDRKSDIPKLKSRMPHVEDEHDESPIVPSAFQSAIDFAGLDMPGGRPQPAMLRHSSSGLDRFDSGSQFSTPYDMNDETPVYLPSDDSDRIPLTDVKYLQPISGSQPVKPQAEEGARSSFQSIRFNAPPRSSRLGDDLNNLEEGHGRQSASGARSRSRSPSTGALTRAGSLMRAMSQRVVNLSNEPEIIENNTRRQPSIRAQPPLTPDPSTFPLDGDTAYHSTPIETTVEKQPAIVTSKHGPSNCNPLRGQTLGIFAPDNPIRLRLCDILVHPITEPLILVLIVLQTVLLAIDAAPDVYQHPRPTDWGDSWNDYALLILFVIYTAEVVARIIVSGFLRNAAEYSTIDREKGIKGAIMDKYQAVFAPQRKASVKPHERRATQEFAPTIVRSFTGFDTPDSAAQQRRSRLARRAFLRHSFNRLDFVAIVAFWISFVLGIMSLESEKHIYVFRMLSCLRILRLLALTNGTTIILQSLKKATPSLVNVSFLIGFFWLLFAIVGVQSFKSSLSRQCLWRDPQGVQPNFNNNFTFCGGHLNNVTGDAEPWIFPDFTPGADAPKGYICPKQSVCMLQGAPYNGTVNFDNILQSLELVFVVMSANTFSDLLYYTTNSDYLAAALFFAAGIVIMMLWLMNLLIAVITSSFQVIREESKTSAFAADQDHLQPAHEEEQLKRPNFIKQAYDKTSSIWIFVIVFGLVCQSCRSSHMSEDLEQLINNAETGVTLLLLLEILIRFAGDWRHFHQSRVNLVDLFLAVVTTVILLPPIRHSGAAYAWLTVFQILRIYRVVLAVAITRKLILLVLGNATGIANLVLFVFLISFLVAIFAVQLFRGELPKYDSSGEVIQVSFSTMWNSFLGMYQILSSENWTKLLYDITAFDNYVNTGWIGAVFFIGWFILANFILVNMFIAVIQENFDVSEDEKRLQQVKAFLQRKELGSSSSNLSLSAILSLGLSRNKRDPLDYGPATMEMLLKEAVVKDFLEEDSEQFQPAPITRRSTALDQTTVVIKPGTVSTLWGKFKSRLWNQEPNPFYSNLLFSRSNEGLDAQAMAKEALSATARRKRAQRDYLARHPRYNVSIFIFEPENSLRRFCQAMVGPGRGHERVDGVEPKKIIWYTFSAVIYAAIVAMVVLACITTPLYQKWYYETHGFTIRNWFLWTDLGFAGLFTIEALIKVVADGFFWTPNAYFRSSWGFIDGIVLITLWVNIGAAMANDGAASRSVGAFKALRALRLLNVSDSARDTFHSVIIVGGRKVISAAFVSMALLLPFAIYGVNLFSGKMLMCNDSNSNIVSLSDCFGEWSSTPFSSDWNVTAPRVVSNPYYSFDNFGESLFILFQIVSQEGWIDVMWSAQSITGRGMQPQDFASQGNAVFFVIFNLLATVFILTLFISVFMRNYTEQTGVAFLTTEQRSWLELRKRLRQVSPSNRPVTQPIKKWKDWCARRATKKHGRWHRAMTWTLVFHLILLIIEYYPEPKWWSRSRDFIFLLFTIFYIVNVIVRIIGLSWLRFRKSSWDLFSLFAVSGTFVTTVLLLTNFQSQIYIQLHKLFLVSITLLLIPRNNALDQLFKTAAASLTTIGNMLATWVVLFLVYAIAMTQTFGLTRFGQNETNNINLRTVPKALILLFRMSCGEGWNQIMEDYATIEPPYCVIGTTFFDSDCGSSNWARALFMSWNILSMYIFVSLFVSLIYESFSYVYQRSSGLEIVSREEIRQYKQAWAMFDPRGTGFVSKESFPRLLAELSGVFSMRIYEGQDSVRRILEDIRGDQPGPSYFSVAGSIGTTSSQKIDIKKLNQRLAQIDTKKVRKQRYLYNLFYEEVMVSADPDRGISFTTLLMIFAHYNIISDNKSLKLEEFLRRRARLQRVEEEVRRRIVIGFFDTMYWSRQFRRYLSRNDKARVTDIPRFAVPEIFVANDSDDDESNKYKSNMNGAGNSKSPNAATSSASPTTATTPTKRPHLSPLDTAAHRDIQRRSIDSGGGGGSPSATAMSQHSAQSGNSPVSPQLSPHHHQQQQQQQRHRYTGSAYSFDMSERGGGGSGSGASSRRVSNAGAGAGAGGAGAENMLEVLDDSVWGDSLRRSFTMRRPGSGERSGGGGGGTSPGGMGTGGS